MPLERAATGHLGEECGRACRPAHGSVQEEGAAVQDRCRLDPLGRRLQVLLQV